MKTPLRGNASSKSVNFCLLHNLVADEPIKQQKNEEVVQETLVLLWTEIGTL